MLTVRALQMILMTVLETRTKTRIRRKSIPQTQKRKNQPFADSCLACPILSVAEAFM